MNTLICGSTLPLLNFTVGRQSYTLKLIAVIVAVVVTITMPGGGNTLRVVALEMVFTTFSKCSWKLRRRAIIIKSMQQNAISSLIINQIKIAVLYLPCWNHESFAIINLWKTMAHSVYSLCKFWQILFHNNIRYLIFLPPVLTIVMADALQVQSIESILPIILNVIINGKTYDNVFHPFHLDNLYHHHNATD